jgi:hypothetical protein
MGRRRLKKPVPMMAYEYEPNPRVPKPRQKSEPIRSLTPPPPKQKRR